jgi:hypothetical protein
MLDAAPHSAFSWGFTVSRNGTRVAEIGMAWFRERADVRIGDERYTVSRESVLKGTFALRGAGRVMARARKVRAWTQTVEVDAGGRVFELRPLRAWKRPFGLFEGGAPVGRVAPTGWLTRRAVIDLPGDLPLPVQVFLFWLVVVLWRRGAAAAP